MSEEKSYMVCDTTNKVYWQRTRHYGYGWDNKEVLETFFTERIDEATLLTKAEAEEEINRLFDYRYVLGGHVKNVNLLCFEILNHHDH